MSDTPRSNIYELSEGYQQFVAVMFPKLNGGKKTKKSGKKGKKTAAKPVKATPASKNPKVDLVAPALSRELSRKASQLARDGVKTHKWQFVTDIGEWADYEKKASIEVEKVYAEWCVDPHIDVRSVRSGDWAYQVDFNLMQQTNIQHHAHKVRKIRRVAI
jgi:hypothetical protein